MGSCVTKKTVKVVNFKSRIRTPFRPFQMTAEEKELVNSRKLEKVPILNFTKSKLYQQRMHPSSIIIDNRFSS